MTELEEQVAHLAARVEMQAARLRNLHGVVSALYKHLGLLEEASGPDADETPLLRDQR